MQNNKGNNLPLGYTESRCETLVELAENYKGIFGIDAVPFKYEGRMIKGVGMEIADYFDKMDNSPSDKLVSKAYEQLSLELTNQFNYILENFTIRFEPYFGNGEPYQSSSHAINSIRNGHMYFFTTDSGFGKFERIKENYMLKKTEFVIEGYRLAINDVFRIVHDMFGHAMLGNSFGAMGEDIAWFHHLQMFSPLAGAALSTETRGQNCWVNFGNHIRNEKNELLTKSDVNWIAPENRPFADQKMNLLPSNISGIEVFEEDGLVKANYKEEWHPIEGVLFK